MPLTYAQIRKKQALLGPDYENLSSDEFAQLMNNITGSQEYDAGLGNGLGKTLKGLSYGIDQGLHLTGLPQLTGGVGNALFGEQGRQAFESVPRMAVDMLPFMRAGKLMSVGTALGAAAMGTNTYEKTNSPAAGLLSAGTAPLFGPAQQLGGRAAVALGERMGLNTARTEALAAGVGGSGLFTGQAATDLVANKMATSLVNGGVLKSGLARGVEQLGEQAGIGVANLAGQAITQAAVAPKGQRWDAVKQMFTDDLGQTLTMTALTQLPFVGMGAIKALGPQRAEVNYERQYADTLKKYDKAVYGPPREFTLANRVEAERRATAPTTAGFQTPPDTSNQAATDAYNAVMSNVPTTPGTNVARVSGATPEMPSAVRAPAPIEARMMRLKGLRDRAAQIGDTRAATFYDTLAAKVADVNGVSPLDPFVAEGLSSPDPAIRLETAIVVNRTMPEIMEARRQALAVKGVSATDAAREVAAVETATAKDAVVKQTAKERQREAEKLATKQREEAFAAQETEAFNKLTEPQDDISAVINNAVTEASKDLNQNLTTSVVSKAVEWEQAHGRDPNKIDVLRTMLKGVTGFVDMPQPNRKSAETIGPKYKTLSEATSARDELSTQPDGDQFVWHIHAKNTKADGDHYVVVRMEHGDSSAQGTGVVVRDAALTPDEAVMQAEEAAAAVVEGAKQPGESNGAKVVADNIDEVWNTYVDKTDPTLLKEVGQKTVGRSAIGDSENEVTRGAARLKAHFDIEQGRLAGEDVAALLGKYKPLWNSQPAYSVWKLAESTKRVLKQLNEPFRQVVANGGKQFGPETNGNPVFIGEQQALGQLLKNVGLDDNHVPEVSALISLIDNPDVAWAQLENNGQTAGLFTKQTDGQKLVWLAASGDPATRTIFTLAHEYIGHYFQKGVAEGRYDAETTNKVNNFYKHVGENTPEQNSILLRELWSTLPKRYRKDAGLQKLVNDRLTDPEEVLANVNGMFALTLVNKGRPGWINEVMTWLPKPVGDMLGVIAKHGRRIFETISGLMYMRRQNWTTGVVDPAQAAHLHRYIETLYSVLKADKRREQMTEYAIRQEMATDPRALMNSLVDGKLWEDGVTTAGNDLVREFRLLKEKDPVNPVREALGKVNRGLNHFLQPLVNYAQNAPWLRQTVVSGAIRQMENNRMEGEILKEMGLVKHGMSYKWAKDAPTEKVMNSPKLATALNELVWRANPMEQTVEQLVAANDPVAMKTLSKLSAPEQQTVRETIARHEVAHQRMNEMIRGQEYERLVYATAETMMLKDPTLQHETAEATARQLVDSVKAGTPMPHETTDFVVSQAGRIEKKFADFSNKPYFVSARRFGDHAVKIVKADGTHSVENFYTPEALQSWMATNRDRIQSGELTPYRLKPDEAVTVNVGKSLLDMIKDREEERRPQIVAELTRSGLTQDQAESIAGRFSEAADLQQEIQAKLVPSMSPHRKFVDGYQNLNALRQQIEYAQMAIHSVTKGVDTARFNMGMMDPRVRNTPEAASIKQAWLQNKSPDMKATRLLQRAGYTWFMSAHLVNMLQDATTAMSGALFGNLVGDGGGVVGTGKRIMTAMKDVKAKSRQTAYEQQMLARYKEGNRGLATFSDEANNDYLASINALESANGMKISSMGDLLTKPIHHGFLAMRNFHKHFTDFGMESGMLATFRHFKAKGLSDAQAEKEAFTLSTVAMGGGKYNRAAGIWGSGRLQPLSAMMTMLQGFAYNQMFTLKNFVAEAISNTPGVTKEQRVQALKAAGVHSGLMFAQAGIFGLPLVAALMAINDKMFDVNSKEAVGKFVADNIDGPDSDMARQIAMHGLINAFGGVDYATKAQLPGVLGLNARDGFSLESLFGPTAGLAKTATDSVDSLLKGNVADAATNILPNNFRRALQAYRDDWEFRRKDGTLITDQASDGEKGLYALTGLRPRSVADTLERDMWQSIDAKNDATERSQWLDDIVTLFKEDPVEARSQILKRASERGEAPAGIAKGVADRLLEMQMPRDAGRRPGASESVNRAAGVRPTNISEVERLQAQQALLQRLNMGMPATPATYKRALMIDQVRAQNPWLSYEEAVNRVEQLTGVAARQQYRGSSFGMR